MKINRVKNLTSWEINKMFKRMSKARINKNKRPLKIRLIMKNKSSRIQIKRTIKKPNRMLKLMIKRLRNLRRVNKHLRI